ncbi:MAG: chemotaxis protein CheD [Dehalococcoidales bacterium]|nr:chemotaxis protein CheD [Dehalococcoidales bacterium]
MVVSEIETVVVGLGELKISQNVGMVLSCIGLGSCIALCMYDPFYKLGAMAHMVLPSSLNGSEYAAPAKYINTGVTNTLKKFRENGAVLNRTQIKIVGGASVLNIPGEHKLNIGERNITAVKQALAQQGLAIHAADIGGTLGRSVNLYLRSGRCVVKASGQKPFEI